MSGGFTRIHIPHFAYISRRAKALETLKVISLLKCSTKITQRYLFWTILLFGPQVNAQFDSAMFVGGVTELQDYMNADYPSGVMKVRALLTQAQASDCRTCQALAHQLLGKFYWANGEYENGIREFRRSLTLARQLGNTTIEASVFDLIGNTYYYQAYYDSALIYFNKALAVYERENDTQGVITVLHNTSLMFHRKGDFSKTIEYMLKEEQKKRTLPESVHEVEAMGAMGGLMVDSIYYKDIIRNELERATKARIQKDSKVELRSYRNVGKAYRQLEEYKLAARYFVKASRMMEDLGQVPDWNLAATDYRDANIPDSAFFYHHKVTPYFPRMTRPNVSYTLELLGDAHRYYKNFDSAQLYYDSALRMSYRMNNRITFTGIHRYLTNVYTNMGEFDLAEEHLTKGLHLARTVALIHERNLFREARLLYEKKGDFSKALLYSDKYRFLQDSIHRAETAVNLTRMQAEFQSAQKAKEVEDLRQQSMLNAAELESRNLQIAVAILLLIVAAALSGWYYTRYRQKTKTTLLLETQKEMIETQNQSLVRQNKINEALLGEIHHRVKNNLQIITSLINLKTQNASSETTETLLQLGNRIFTMGLVHEKLYRTEDVQTVRLDVYLEELTNHLLLSLASKDRVVKREFACDAIEIEADRALACGLICNELMTNSLKYAFVHFQNTCAVGLRLTRHEGKIEWTMQDNGVTDAQSQNTGQSFGLRFVDQLVTSKLGGTWRVERDAGFKAIINIPLAS